ncbi:MAG: MlaD family protein [Odoribacteraceae bacterium]|jgi:phospholipid/cholesterol/gamma-HCH transport system substrate-binding protein|nr:MlaD family protein [Odoribacteraceae bacterium]
MKIKREAKLALAAILAVSALIWGISYLKGISLFETRNVYYGVYDRVEGLKISSGVLYRGYQVGQVTGISFTGKRNDKVLVTFSVKKELQLPGNTLASIQSGDLMGTKVINLLPGDWETFANSGDTLRSEVEQGLIEQVSQQILPLKQKAETLFASLDSVLVIVQGLFNEKTKQSLSGSFLSIGRTLANLEFASGNLDTLLRTESGRLRQILDNVYRITTNLENSNEDIATFFANLAEISDSLREANPKRSLDLLNQLLQEFDSIAGKINQGDGTLGALVKDSDLYYNLNMATENLNRLLVEFRYNPKKFIRLSLLDFSSSKEVFQYGVVIHESTERLSPREDIYKQHPDLREIKYKDRYIYLIATYKRLKSAQEKLKGVIEQYNDAYIVKIDFE